MVSIEESDPHLALQQGYELHQRGRRSDAEVSYRRAVAGGRLDAWLYLGALLWSQSGRDREAQEAFRAALEAETPELRSRAALNLGEMLEYLDGERGQARYYYELALPSAVGRDRSRALLHLAYLAGQDGRRAEAMCMFRQAATALAQARDAELSATAVDRIASLFAVLAGRRRSGRILRRHRARMWRLRRARSRLLGSRRVIAG